MYIEYRESYQYVKSIEETLLEHKPFREKLTNISKVYRESFPYPASSLGSEGKLNPVSLDNCMDPAS